LADLTVDLGVNAGNSDSVLGGLAGGLGDVSASALNATDSLGDVGLSAEDMASFMDMGERRADALARAQNDVEQASLDMEQATRDAAQAQLDINQAQRDGAQAGIDLEQALLDQKKAQKDYNDAVKEFGAGSLEAQQAQIDMKQANEDVKQAQEDAKQSTEDLKQAQLDGKQATLDSKNAQLDLNEAQRNVVAPTIMDSWIGTVLTVVQAIGGLIGVFALLQGGMLTTAATSVGAALTTVGSWIAMAATATLSALEMAAAWLLSIWPIALIIAAVVGLTILIVKNWDTIKEWTIKIFKAIWSWLKDLWDDIVDIFFWAIDTVKYLFLNFTPLGLIIKNWGGITGWISNMWKNVSNVVWSAIKNIGGFFKGMWNGITEGLKSALNAAIYLLNLGIWSINKLISGANRVPGVNIPFIPYIPYLAEGGITTGPTMAMIGEGTEQEAVLPLSKLQGLIDMKGGSDRPIILQINGGGFREFLQENVRVTSGGDIVKYAGGA
jgi:hypothetical protein